MEGRAFSSTSLHISQNIPLIYSLSLNLVSFPHVLVVAHWESLSTQNIENQIHKDWGQVSGAGPIYTVNFPFSFSLFMGTNYFCCALFCPLLLSPTELWTEHELIVLYFCLCCHWRASVAHNIYYSKCGWLCEWQREIEWAQAELRQCWPVVCSVFGSSWLWEEVLAGV